MRRSKDVVPVGFWLSAHSSLGWVDKGMLGGSGLEVG